MTQRLVNGWYQQATILKSPFYNERPTPIIDVLVIHNISLPLGQFGAPYIQQLFLGTLNCNAHPSFADLNGLEVSSHFLIDRQGSITQFVSTEHRAWHAGKSSFQGRDNCNDFSIGIELEGTDFEAFDDAQYQALSQLTRAIMATYPIAQNHIVGHSDIAPDRKTDPGPYFDWQRYKNAL